MRFFLRNLALCVFLAGPAVAHDPTGKWVDSNGYKVNVTRSGSRLTIAYRGPKGLETFYGTVQSDKAFEYVVGGVNYKATLYGRTITIAAPGRFVGQWMRVLTPTEGPDAVRHDPTGTWTSGRELILTIRTKGEQILVECLDLEGRVYRGKGRWTSTNGFEFGLEGFKGKLTCVVDWRQGPRTGPGEFQIYLHGPKGDELYTRMWEPGQVQE